MDFQVGHFDCICEIANPMALRRCITLVIALTSFASLGMAEPAGRVNWAIDRSPVDLSISPNRQWLATANETSGSVSLVEVATGQVVDEIIVGEHPADIKFLPDSSRILVTTAWSGELLRLAIDRGRLRIDSRLALEGEPCGIAIASNGSRAFVGLAMAATVVEIDLAAGQVVRRIKVGNWPRYLTLSPDGSRLAVGCGGDGRIAVIDTQRGEVLYDEPLSGGTNLGHMTASADGQYAYFTWMVYRTNPITKDNIRRGWILASRIGRVRLDGESYREAISLDVPGEAVADPHGLSISRDGRRMVATSSGTHELLVYRLPDLPFIGTGGPGDLIDPSLEHDRKRFDRIELGGRPMGAVIGADSRTAYIANYLRNSVQVVDLETRRVNAEIELGGPDEPSIERRGMAVFYDARHSLDQWYSCHSCHQNGGGNARPMDTWNDGTQHTLKTVLPLYDLTRTAPWTWHGWQEDLNDAMHKSFTSTMQGVSPDERDVTALVAFLKSMPRPPKTSSNREAEDSTNRGKRLFESEQTGCTDCHSGPLLTDNMIHDVGLGSASDAYDGYNTPSLLGTSRKVRWLHSGRAKSLARVVGDLHSPEKVSGKPKLTAHEVKDLVAFLKTL